MVVNDHTSKRLIAADIDQWSTHKVWKCIYGTLRIQKKCFGIDLKDLDSILSNLKFGRKFDFFVGILGQKRLKIQLAKVQRASVPIDNRQATIVNRQSFLSDREFKSWPMRKCKIRITSCYLNCVYTGLDVAKCKTKTSFVLLCSKLSINMW